MLFSGKTYKGEPQSDGTIRYGELSAAIWDFKQRSEGAYAALRNVLWPLCWAFFNSKNNKEVYALFAKWATKYTGDQNPYDPWKGPGVFDPVPHYQVMVKVPPIHEAVFGDGDLPFLCEPFPVSMQVAQRNEGQLWLDAEIRQKRLTAQWYGDMKMHVMGDALLRDTFIFGNVPLLFEHAVGMDVDWALQEDQATGWGFKARSNSRPVRGVRCLPIPLPDFFPDEHGRSMDGVTGQACEACGVRYLITIDKLISWILGTPLLRWNIPVGAQASRDTLREWFAKQTGVIGSVTSEDDWPAQMDVAVDRRSTTPASGGNEQRVLMFRYFEGGEDPRHVISLGRDGQGPVILNQNAGEHPARNAGIPITLVQSIPLLNHLFGLSTIEEILMLAAYNNLLINLDLATRARASSGVGLVNPLSGLSAARMALQPGGTYDVNQMVSLDQAYKHIPIPFVNAQIHEIVQTLRQQMHVTAGGVDPLLGFASGETARASMIATEQGSKRWGDEAKVIRHCLTRGGEIVDALNQQYTTELTQFQPLGKRGMGNWVQAGPQNYGHKVRVFLDSRELVSNPGARQQAVQTFVATWQNVQGTDIAKLRTLHAKTLKLPDPEGYNLPRQNRADVENSLFEASLQEGQPYMPEVSPSDNDWDHWNAHWDIEGAARQGGQQAFAVWANHQMAHLQKGQFDGGARAASLMAPEGAGPQGEPGPMGIPPVAETGSEQGMPLGNAAGMDQFANEAAQTPGLPGAPVQ